MCIISINTIKFNPFATSNALLCGQRFEPAIDIIMHVVEKEICP